MAACPHCLVEYDYDNEVHVCADREAWTQAERDERRAQAKRRHPALVYAPSTAQMQARFGARNREDRRA